MEKKIGVDALLDSFEFSGLPVSGNGTLQNGGEVEGHLFDNDDLDDQLDDEEEEEEREEEGYDEVFPDGYCDAETEKLIFSDFAASSSENDDTSSEYSSSCADSDLSSPSSNGDSDCGDPSGSENMKKTLSIDQSIQLLKEIHTIPPFFPPLNPSDLSTLYIKESQNPRYVIKTAMKKYLHIFPWFSRNSKARYRELINRRDSQIILENIIISLQYWYSRRKPFTEEELDMIRNYYLTNNFPLTEFMLTHITRVTYDIQKLLCRDQTATSVAATAPSTAATPSTTATAAAMSASFMTASVPPSSPGATDSSTDPDPFSSEDPASREAHLDIHDRLNLHDEQLHHIEKEVTDLKVRSGGDRGGWLRIRSEDLPTRSQWCIEGGVFGAYADGVGPLVACDVRRKKSVIVYSTDPDTVEDLPDTENPDRFVRYVMVPPSFPSSSLPPFVCPFLSFNCW
jgi:hypothetical protein